MRIWLLSLFLLVPSLSLATYQNPTVVAKNAEPNGFLRVVFDFAGDAGEPSIQRTFLIRPTTTATAVRNWIHETKAELNFLFAASNIAGLQVGQTVPSLAPVAPTLTAQEEWSRKFRRYLKVKDSGIVALAADVATLKADLEATYQGGFLDAE